VHVPEHVEAAVLKALSRDPKDRHPTAAAFSDALAGKDQPTAAPPGSAPETKRDPAPAKAGRGGCFGSVLVVLASAAAGLLLS
jgi:hypothetical protein